MRKVLALSAFLVFSPVVLVLNLYLLSQTFHQNLAQSAPKANIAYAALPQSSGTLKSSIEWEDARIVVVREFFQKYKSALLPHAQDVIVAADKYGLDYRLIPAIAMQESNLCKKVPKNSYNCWGFGIYGKKVTKFDNYQEAINTVTKTLANQYKAKGLETPEEIMSKYTPSNNGAWADSVNHFMNQLAISL